MRSRSFAGKRRGRPRESGTGREARVTWHTATLRISNQAIISEYLMSVSEISTLSVGHSERQVLHVHPCEIRCVIVRAA